MQKRMRFVQMLRAEVNEVEESGLERWSAFVEQLDPTAVRAGDLRELQGVLGQRVFHDPVTPDSVGEGARVIDAKVVRVLKNGLVKSRLVLRDFRGSTTYLAEELFAATPADGALR